MAVDWLTTESPLCDITFMHVHPRKALGPCTQATCLGRHVAFFFFFFNVRKKAKSVTLDKSSAKLQAQSINTPVLPIDLETYW